MVSIILLLRAEHAQASSLVDTGIEILGTTTCQRCRGSSIAADGDIITDHRCRLLSENVETLIFLKYNSDLLEMYGNIWIYHLMLSDSFDLFWLWCCFMLILKSGSSPGSGWIWKFGIRYVPSYSLPS